LTKSVFLSYEKFIEKLKNLETLLRKYKFKDAQNVLKELFIDIKDV